MNHGVALVLSYLIGAIPFGVLVARIFGGIDIRQHGSKSSGATNVWRTMGKKYGGLVFLLDFLKGVASVAIARYLSESAWIWALAATIVVVGHIYPVFAGFKGGRGVATGLGSLVILVPIAVLLSLVVWGVVVYATRYVSLGSILGAVTAIVVASVLWFIDSIELASLVYCLITATIIIWAHRENIGRLRTGTENRFGESKKSSFN